MTSPTAYPEDNDRYDGAIEELSNDLFSRYSRNPDDGMILELSRAIIESGDDSLVIVLDAGGAIPGTLRVEFELKVTHDEIVSACDHVATRRIDARLKVDDSFRQFVDTGKWPREEP